MQAKGSNAQIIYQKEDTFNVDPSTPSAQALTFVSESIKANISLVEDDSIRGNRNPVQPIQDKVSVSGDLTVNLQANNIGSLFYYALGNVVTTDTSGSAPYTHTITIANSLPSFLLEKGFKDIGAYFKYNGCKVEGFTLNFTPTGYQKCTFRIVGVRETVGTSSFDPSAKAPNYVPFDGINNLITIKEGGSVIGIVTDLNVEVSNNIKTDDYVLAHGGTVASLPEGIVSVKGTMNVQFVDTTLYQKAVSGTETSLFIEFQRGTGDGTAGNEYMSINIPELLFETETPEISDGGPIVVGLPFTAYYNNSSEASSIEIVIKNEEATL